MSIALCPSQLNTNQTNLEAQRSAKQESGGKKNKEVKNAGKHVTGAWQRREHTESPVKNTKKQSKRCKYISVMENEGTMSLVAGKHVLRSKHQEK